MSTDSPTRPSASLPLREALFEYSKNYCADMHPTFHFSEGYAAAERALQAELEQYKNGPIALAHMKACQRNEEYLDKIAALEKERDAWAEKAAQYSAEIEVHCRGAEKFGDLSGCYVAEDIVRMVHGKYDQLRMLAKELRDALMTITFDERHSTAGKRHEIARDALERADSLLKPTGDSNNTGDENE